MKSPLIRLQVIFFFIALVVFAQNGLDNLTLYALGATPLPDGCTGGLPPGDLASACCINGLVYIDGEIVAGAEVTIQSEHGIAHLLTQVFPGTETRPYYRVSLSSAPLSVVPGDVITIIVSYSGHVETITHTVQPDGQQIDIILSRNQAEDHSVEEQIWQPATSELFGPFTRIAFDSLNNVYVGDLYSSRVIVFDNNGALLRQWGSIGNLPGQFGVRDIAIDSSDNVYVVDDGNNQIHKYSSSGSWLQTIGTGFGDGVGQFSYPYGIAIDSKDNVYIVEAGNDRVQKFDSSGNFLISWGSTGSNDGEFLAPEDIAIDSFDNIYVSDRDNERIQKFDSQGVFIAKWGSDGSGEGQFDLPREIAIDGDNNVYVVDGYLNRVQKFDANGVYLTQWGTEGSDSGQFTLTSGIAVDRNNQIYVTDSSERIQIFNDSGVHLTTWAGGFEDSQIGSPAQLDIDSEGNYYILDAGLRRVQKMDENFSLLTSWGAKGTGAGLFLSPRSLAIDSNDNVYVSDWENHYIQKFESNGAFITSIGRFGNGNGEFDHPVGIALDSQDNIYVADEENHRIQKFDSNGVFIISWGSQGTTEGLFNRPEHIAIDSNDMIYVSDWFNGRVQKFDSDGVFQTSWGSSGTDDGQFTWVYGLSVDANDNIYTVEFFNSRIQKFTNTGTWLASWQENGSGLGQFYNPTTIKVDNNNNLLISDLWNGRIQTFAPMTYTRPIGTISYIPVEASNLSQDETLTVHGLGADSDETNTITTYRWTSSKDGELYIGPSPILQVPASDLSIGTHDLTLEVQDDEGEWSDPVTAFGRIFLAPEAPPPPPGEPPVEWTVLLYLVGDYDDNGLLASDYTKLISRLNASFDNPAVRIAIQIDGPASIGTSSLDTRRWTVTPDQGPQEVNWYTEQKMDDPSSLTDFILWGQNEFPAPNYYLVIADHGQAAEGIGWDHTTDFLQDGSIQGDTYLTVAEVAQALTAPDVAPLNVVHLDGCSMNIVEVAYQLRDTTQFLVDSQYLAWDYFAYDEYIQNIQPTTTPSQLAQIIVDRYATLASAESLPYTLTALDLSRVDPLATGTDNLAVLLAAWVENDPDGSRVSLLDTLRSASQKFDSDGNFVNNDLDDYVDLLDWVVRVRDANLTQAITAEANKLINELEGPIDIPPFIVANEAQSNYLPSQYANGAWIDIGKANGVSIYYPVTVTSPPTDTLSSSPTVTQAEPRFSETYVDYLNNKLFDFTLVSRWDEFLAAAVGEPEPDEPLAPRLGPGPILALPEPGPRLIRPADGAQLRQTRPTFLWQPMGRGVTYEIQLDSDPAFLSLPISTGHAPRFKPDDPLSPGTYYWRVRFIDADGNASRWSATRDFMITHFR